MLIKYSLMRLAATIVFLLSIAIGGVLTFAYLSGKAMPASSYVIAILLTVFLYGVFSLFNTFTRRF